MEKIEKHDCTDYAKIDCYCPEGVCVYGNKYPPVEGEKEDKLTEKDFNKSMVKKWIGGYQPTDKLDTSNPPRQTAHEDKGAEESIEFLFEKYCQTFTGNGDYCFSYVNLERLKLIISELSKLKT